MILSCSFCSFQELWSRLSNNFNTCYPLKFLNRLKPMIQLFLLLLTGTIYHHQSNSSKFCYKKIIFNANNCGLSPTDPGHQYCNSVGVLQLFYMYIYGHKTLFLSAPIFRASSWHYEINCHLFLGPQNYAFTKAPVTTILLWKWDTCVVQSVYSRYDPIACWLLNL